MSFVIDKTIEIDAPAAVVWQVVRDLPRYREWNPFCVECSSTLQPGDAIDMKVKLLGKPQAQREWMKSYEEGRGFSYSMKPVPLGALSSLRSHEIQALGPARTRYRSYFRLQGWLKPLVLGLFGAKLQAGFAGMTEALGSRAETLWRRQQV